MRTENRVWLRRSSLFLLHKPQTSWTPETPLAFHPLAHAHPQVFGGSFHDPRTLAGHPDGRTALDLARARMLHNKTPRFYL
jgi:hypothetical protein